MRLALFGDIHDNLPALEAALADMDAHSPDARICLGDVTAGGAWPRECLQVVAALGQFSELRHRNKRFPVTPFSVLPSQSHSLRSVTKMVFL